MSEWDEAKRRSNLAKHGLDFAAAEALFDGRPVLTFPATFEAEERLLSIGLIDGRFCTLVWTWRDGRQRFISLRRSRDEEKQRYGRFFQ
jgi:hypothetical protein